MAAHAWDDVLSDLDRAIYAGAGLGRRAGGGERPALLVVDVTYDFVGDTPLPVLESIVRFPSSCGDVGWRAMERIRELLDACRRAQLPIFYTRALSDRPPITRGAWDWKKSSNGHVPDGDAQAIGNHIPDLVAPLPGELIVEKTKPSGFFGTPLLSYLVALQVDTVIVTGATTSGCVRATVLDAFSNNLRSLVVEDAVFDRGDMPHKINLFDMHAKYADVIATTEALDYIDQVATARATSR